MYDTEYDFYLIKTLKFLLKPEYTILVIECIYLS